nr:hypothetical protein GCM10025730_29150 [Promicromonospora thailandica]
MRSNKVLVTRGLADVPDRSARGAVAPRGSGFANLTEAVDAVAAVDALLASLAASRAVLMESVREWVADRPEQFGAPEPEADDVAGLAPELVEQLARALRVPEGSAVALIEESRALVHEHPRTLAALRGGTSATPTRRRSSATPTVCAGPTAWRWRLGCSSTRGPPRPAS